MNIGQEIQKLIFSNYSTTYDYYSFLFRKSSSLYNRRQSKIMTTVVSLFTSSYVFNWSKYFPETQLKYPPSFDGRTILYPSSKEIRDYFSWRQVDSEELFLSQTSTPGFQLMLSVSAYQ